MPGPKHSRGLASSIREGLDGARAATGTAVIIDVMRAFSTAAWAFASGAEQIVLVGTGDEAHALRRAHPDWLLAGESRGRKIDGFDFGNSPEAVAGADLRGRTLVLRSSSGTQGVVSTPARQILLGSLAVAGATVRWLLRARPAAIDLVPMRSLFGPDGDEDNACAEYMAALLRGGSVDPAPYVERVRTSPAAAKGYDPAVDWQSPGDVEHACAVDAFAFAMPVRREGELLVARPVAV